MVKVIDEPPAPQAPLRHTDKKGLHRMVKAIILCINVL